MLNQHAQVVNALPILIVLACLCQSASIKKEHALLKHIAAPVIAKLRAIAQTVQNAMSMLMAVAPLAAVQSNLVTDMNA